MKDKKNILIVIAVIWALIIIYNINVHYGNDGNDGGNSSGQSAVGARGEKIPAIKLALLEQKPPKYKGVKKDIFKSLTPPPRPKPVVKKGPVVVAPVVPPPPTPMETFVQNTKFTGFIENEEGKTVILSRGDDAFFVKHNDLIDGRFRVQQLSSSQLDIKDEVSGESATIVPTE